jgi:LysM repeat protein
MRALHRVSFVLLPLLAAGTVSAHHVAPPKRGNRAVSTPRARQAPRPGGRAALLPRASEPARMGSHAASDHVCPKSDDQGPKSSVVMRSHRIARGDSLSGIAALYATSVQALAAANGLKPSDIIRTGQELVIPEQARPGGGSEWLKYAHAPEHPGTVDLSTYKARYRGTVIEKGRLKPEARAAISELLGVKGSRPAVPDRLIRLLVRVSDTFGGRPIRIVSGYRTSSFFSDSRHKQSSAVDFSIPGIPNSVVREYLLLFDDAGVGYYPNSSFVHLDVRPCAMQWIDYAGPGEAPRLHPSTPRFAGAGKRNGTPSVSDLDEIAEGVAAAMNEDIPPSRAPRPEPRTAERPGAPAAERPSQPSTDPHAADTVTGASDRRE